MHRGQMEIMGLAIIVILISIGMLFSLTMLSRDKEPMSKAPETKSLAVYFLNTFLGTTSECKDATFRELIQDCAQSLAIPCPGADSCTYIGEKLEFVLEKTLIETRKTFWIEFSGASRVEDLNRGDFLKCEQLERERATQYIPLRGAGTVTVTLDICG